MKKFVRSSALIACAVVGFSVAAHADQFYYSNGYVMPVAYTAPVAYYGNYNYNYITPVTTQVAYINDGYGQTYMPSSYVMPVAYYGYPTTYGYIDPVWHNVQ